MSKTAHKLSILSLSADFFPQPIWQAALKTRESIERLKQNWTDIELSDNAAISIYDCYPYLFLSAFSDLPDSAVADFSVAIKLLASSVFQADKIMDANSTKYASTNALSHVFAFQVEAYMLFQKLFTPNSPFWPHFRLYFDAYLHACQLEKQFAAGKIIWQKFDEQTARTLAIGKASLSRSVIAGLTALQGDMRMLPTLSEALDTYNFAYQMFDDLSDWKEDYLAQSPSLLLCRWLPERPAQPKLKDLEHLARELYYDGHASDILQIAIEATNHALKLTADIPDLSWRLIPTNLLERCTSLHHDILRITQVNRRRTQKQMHISVELPAAETLYEQLAWRGLQFLVRQWQLGFGEACDISRFAHSAGFTGESEFQYGDIFQRAIIADVLLEASSTFQLHLQPIIEYEINYLLDRRLRGGIGGWSYFPDLPEMPPDADDLAQVIQLLIHSEQRDEITQFCEQPLTTLLSQNNHDDGSFETWIIPREYRTAQQEWQYAYTLTVWGTGPDVDVMANLLYALALYDEERFLPIINAGAAYIEKQQQPDGSWSSTWYHGSYYGTFVCMRLLAHIKPSSLALERAEAFLSSSQLDDGSWALDGHIGDPLSTSLALLSWLELVRVPDHRPAFNPVDAALSFLQQSYQEDKQAWPTCDFIRVAEGRTTGHVTRVTTYGSQSITTTFVLKALTGLYSSRELLATSH